VLRIRSRTTSSSKSNPWENETFAGEAAGDRLVLNMLRIIACCDAMGVFWLVENPSSSRLWDPPACRTLRKRGMWTLQFLIKAVLVYRILWHRNSSTRKRTNMIGTLPLLETICRECKGAHEHQHVEDCTVFEGRSIKRSILAGRYPEELCEAIAHLVQLAQGTAHSARSRRPRTLSR
jgi:hypothetical protein